MTDTIENPTADQLEAGGTITGTFYGLPFTDWPLTADRGWLTAGGVGGPGVRDSNGRYCGGWAITFYTPPEPKPWWETCTGYTWVRWVDSDGEVLVLSACRFRQLWVTEESRAARNPRRVLIADADTEVIVPRAAVDQLRRRHDSRTDRVAVRLFLAAVDERGDHAD